MEYGKYYDKLTLREPSPLEKFFINLLTEKAKKIGQSSHEIWTLKYLVDNYTKGSRLTVVDIGTHGGWALTYNSPRIAEKIGIEYDEHFAEGLRKKGIKFHKVDLQKARIPLESSSADIVTICSTLEHVHDVYGLASEMQRILKKGGVVYVVVPDMHKFKSNFWNDVTHRRPFTRESLGFLLESSGFETLKLENYNHNFFMASFLLPDFFRGTVSKLFGRQLVYIGRKN